VKKPTKAPEKKFSQSESWVEVEDFYTAIAVFCGAVAGIVIPLLGGRLMARSFPVSRFRLDRIGALLGEEGFGPVSHIITGGLEGALFGGCIIGAMLLAKRGYGISAKP
jgi:hypothetical protein